jgi:hypothetical protein
MSQPDILFAELADIGEKHEKHRQSAQASPDDVCNLQR